MAGFIALIDIALVLLALLALAGLFPVWSTITLTIVMTSTALWRLHYWPGRHD